MVRRSRRQLILDKKILLPLSTVKTSAICIALAKILSVLVNYKHYYTGEDGEEAAGGGERVLEVGVGCGCGGVGCGGER